MKRQRGFELIKLALVLGIVLVVVGIVYAIKSAIENYAEREYARGKAEVTAKWQEADRIAGEAAIARHAEDQKIAAAHALDLQSANARAAAAEENLRRARNEKRKQNEPSTVVEGCSPPAAGDARRPVVHFTWGWVRDYDAAWTGAAGEPVFGDRPDAAGAAPGAVTASPYGPDELADVHAGNAGKCSRIRRQLNKLLDTLEDLEAKHAAAEVPQ